VRTLTEFTTYALEEGEYFGFRDFGNVGTSPRVFSARNYELKAGHGVA
jgi:hypothetical protein